MHPNVNCKETQFTVNEDHLRQGQLLISCFWFIDRAIKIERQFKYSGGYSGSALGKKPLSQFLFDVSYYIWLSASVFSVIIVESKVSVRICCGRKIWTWFCQPLFNPSMKKMTLKSSFEPQQQHLKCMVYLHCANVIARHFIL